MCSFRILVYLVVLILGVEPALVYAKADTLLGPITYVRGKGKPTTKVQIFNFSGFRPPFTLHLQNGKPDGSNCVSGAKVWLNGKLLFRSSDFSQQVSRHVVPVELTDSSSLKVWFDSKPSSEITLWIEGVPNTPPMADAGPDQPSNILVGDVVILDGSASSDPEGNELTYSWMLLAVPEDSTAELSDPTAVNPSFDADEPGTYTAVLTVNDGFVDSVDDDASITVVIPPPLVSIDTPENFSLVWESLVTVTGTVDDHLATIKVDGDATPNNNGDYSADVELLEGENTVTVVAVNSTGEGNASVDVTLRSERGPCPAMTITTPKPDFIEGLEIEWDGFGSAPAPDSIPVAVSGIITAEFGTPTVMVNGVVATISPLDRGRYKESLCSIPPFSFRPFCDQRYNFSAEIKLSKGQRTIIAKGQDTMGGSSEVSVNGVADYCFKGVAENGVFAEYGNRQNNRCHEIDGCSIPRAPDGDTNALRNRPMPFAMYNRGVIVEFGSGYIPVDNPKNDFFVHGQKPRDALGCNIHDTCYQTCVPKGGGARALAYNSCNYEQFENHKAMCRKAYPSTCPFTIMKFGVTFPDPTKCAYWLQEKYICFVLKNDYAFGVEVGGFPAYKERQDEYCVP